MPDSIRHFPVRPRALIGSILALAALAVALWMPSPAGAVTLGSTHVADDSQGGIFCGGFANCAYTQLSLPDGAMTRAPFDGRIRSFRVNLGDPGTLQLLVVHQRPHGRYRAIEGSTVRTTSTRGVHSFGTNLPIRKGDLIGLNLLDESVSVRIPSQPGRGAAVAGFLPAFDIGDVQHTYAPFTSSLTELEFNAQLERGSVTNQP
jgi:hypothetical protein